MSFISRLFKRIPQRDLNDKLELYSMRQVDNKSIFKIKKNGRFFKNFRILLSSLGFKGVETWHHDSVLNREFPINKLVNFCDTFKTKNCEIDLVFTQDSIVIILRGSNNTRIKFVEELMKFCRWSKIRKKIQPLRKNF